MEGHQRGWIVVWVVKYQNKGVAAAFLQHNFRVCYAFSCYLQIHIRINPRFYIYV